MTNNEVTLKKSFVIAIDGPGGVGKSTVSKLVARELGGIYVDTGAMYRAFALALKSGGVDPDDDEALEKFCHEAQVVYRPDNGAIFIDDRDYSGHIRSEEAGALASKAAVKSTVRRTLVAYQRTFSNSGALVVMEGRDIGTVVFPEADIKFFLDADAEVRAMRRLREGHDNLQKKEIEKILTERDRQDSEREDSPLEQAGDAVYIDTTSSDITVVVSLLLTRIKKILPPL